MKFLERALDHQNQWWKYLVVILIGFIAGQVIGSIPLVVLTISKVIVGGGDMFTSVTDLTVLGISKNVIFILLMLPFVISLLFTVLLIKALHKRSYKETVNGTNKLRYGRLAVGFVLWTILMAAFYTGDYLINPSDFVLQFDWTKFLPLFLISILLIPLQTTYEELLFRGYLAQGVAALTRNRIMAILLPGLVFGLIHIGNPEVKEFGFLLAMSQYIFFGLLFGLIAILDDGIELPIGMHAANNIFLSLFITHESSAFQTDAVFEQLNINPIKDSVFLYVAGVIAVIYFAYRYKWSFRVLTKRVEE